MECKREIISLAASARARLSRRLLDDFSLASNCRILFWRKNMEYILADKIKITRPFVFLCGPYYEKSKSSDRRNILRENIHQIYKTQGQDVLPLIVDLFLTSDNIDFNEYSVQLLEEICAAVSCQTHILLDTMSAATELGIFANSAYNNEICVYVPKNSDVYNQGNVGYFVREAVVKKPRANIRYVEYRPRIVKRAYSTVFTAEHYAFNEDKIPQNIKQLLEEGARKNKLACDLPITYVSSSNMPQEFNQICYFEKDNKLSVIVSIKLLFYIVASILHQEYPDIVKGKVSTLSETEMEEVSKKSTGAILNSVAFYLGTDRNSYTETEISTVVCEGIETVAKHIIKFVLVYYTKSQFKSMLLISNSAHITQLTNVENHPNVIFNLSKEQMILVEQINENPERYFESIMISSGKKQREIVKYVEAEEGDAAKQLHHAMDAMFRSKYKHSQYSFAYHKGSSIRKCVECHINSKWFLKLDIKKFFSSISKTLVLQKIVSDLQIDKHYISIMDKIFSCCFYEEKLPLGLVMSPMISDYFLYDFDVRFGKYCVDNRLIYTRYADDIMISSRVVVDNNRRNDITSYIVQLLNGLGLKLNDEKSMCVNFDEEHSFIRYVGINIVKGEGNNPNYLSVGKKYIFNLAKDYIEYDKRKNSIDECDEERKKKMEISLFYTRAELIGKIDFIKHVEGSRGVERLKIRLSKYYPDIDLNAL